MNDLTTKQSQHFKLSIPSTGWEAWRQPVSSNIDIRERIFSVGKAIGLVGPTTTETSAEKRVLKLSTDRGGDTAGRCIGALKTGRDFYIPVVTHDGARPACGDVCWSHPIVLLLRRELELPDVGLGRDNSRAQWSSGKTILYCTPERCSVGIGRPGDDGQFMTKSILGVWRSVSWPHKRPNTFTSTRLSRCSLHEKPPTIMRASRGSCIRFICSSMSVRTYR